jgi:hypothetical protein
MIPDFRLATGRAFIPIGDRRLLATRVSAEKDVAGGALGKKRPDTGSVGQAQSGECRCRTPIAGAKVIRYKDKLSAKAVLAAI